MDAGAIQITVRDNNVYRDAFRLFVASHGVDPRSGFDHSIIALRAIAISREKERERCAKIVMSETQWPQRGHVVDTIRSGE